MIFGVFDRLHDGHQFFLTEAQKLGESLIVAVAPDSVVMRLKGRTSVKNEQDRMAELQEALPGASIILGDRDDHSWEGVETHRPDCIALGYDQTKLYVALERARTDWPFLKEIILIADHHGDRLHSSML